MEKRYRSVIKGLTWRILATLTTVLISWLITGKIEMALSIGSIEVFAKMALYYFHERTWNKVNLGKAKPIEYEI
jgi:uncharacterized membrane protein